MIQSDYMIKYTFPETGDMSTDEANIMIGFSTQEKRGLLMFIGNNDPRSPEYISVEINNNGKGIKPGVDRYIDKFGRKTKQNISIL